MDAHKNFAYSTVATAPSPASSGTSLVVASGEGSRFPATPFNATVWPSGAQPLPTNAEIVRVTNIATDTLTITRAQESTSARSITVGDQIAATVTAATLTDIEGLVWDGVVRKTADEQLNSSTTLQNDDHLFIPVSANVPTFFSLLLHYAGTAAGSGTADMKHDFALSTGSVVRAWRQHVGFGPTTIVMQAGQVADLSTVIQVGIAGGAESGLQKVEGMVIPSADATLNFRWAQNTSDAAYIVVKAGSTLAYRKMT